MINRQKICRRPAYLSLIIWLVIGLVACQSQTQAPPAEVGIPAAQSEEEVPGSAAPEQSTASEPQSDPAPPAEVEVAAASDPAAIEAGWQSSPHADTFVLDSLGQNNTCARCHAPVNWLPSMGDLPESCFACKFELKDPPPLIAESEWVDIPCKVCHKVDKKDNVQPEYAWLEIAPLDEYAAVASPTELCLKCHATTDIPGHGNVNLVSAHADYECTGCHSAHDTTASCGAAGCHSDVIEPATPIPGHDADHQAVSCVACHDSGGMEVRPDEGSGVWVTFYAGPAADGADELAFTSHNVVLEVSCDRCHFADNPWGLSASVTQP